MLPDGALFSTRSRNASGYSSLERREAENLGDAVVIKYNPARVGPFLLQAFRPSGHALVFLIERTRISLL